MTIARVRILLCRSATVGAPCAAALDRQWASLSQEFPTVAFSVEAAEDEKATMGGSRLDLAKWADHESGFRPFDLYVEGLATDGEATLTLEGEADTAAKRTLEVLTRYQRLICRRNAGSSTREFARLLERFPSLHDLTRPLVHADFNHAVDAWQWVLRLDADASEAVQMAALLHDVERLVSEADARVEHRAASYVRFKEAHAVRGARIASDLLEQLGVPTSIRERVATLIAMHETAADSQEQALLADADALSFFSQNSAGYLDYFGGEQTVRKIRYTLGRMRQEARARLPFIRLRTDVEELVNREMSREMPRSGWNALSAGRVGG